MPSPHLAHSAVSMTAHALWGLLHRFDLNTAYVLDPKLSWWQACLLWWFAVIGHVVSTV